MTGPKENNEFCFPRLSLFPEAKLKETLKSRGKKTQCLPRGKSLGRTWKKNLLRKAPRKYVFGGAIQYFGGQRYTLTKLQNAGKF